MSVIEIIAIFEGLHRECEHDKQLYGLIEAKRCYMCVLDRVMRQPPTVTTCFDLVYIENTLERDEKLQELLRGCHYNDAPDSFHLAQVMWDTLTCCSKENLESCSANLIVSARLLTRLMRFVPLPNCIELTRNMLISFYSVPKPCREGIVAAVVECVRENPKLAYHLRDEAWLLFESAPQSLHVIMLTTQILKFTTEVPIGQVERYAEGCVSILLNACEDDVRLRCVAASGLELVSKRYPEALQHVPNHVLHSLFESLGGFESAVVQRLCSSFTSGKVAAGVMRTKCLDKILADCLLTCQDNLVIETVLDSLIAGEQQLLQLICANMNTMLHSLLSLLDTRSADRGVTQKVFNLMSILFSQPRTCLINELFVAKVVHHCARNCDDSSDTHLAARRCFVSFLNGGHLSKRNDFAVASSALSECFSGSRRLPLPELLRATLNFMETLSSTTCQSAQEKHSHFARAFLEELLPRIITDIEVKSQSDTSIVPQLLKVVVIIVEYLRIHREASLRTLVEPCVRRMWPSFKSQRENSDARRLLTLFVFLVGDHRDEEDFEVIETGFRHSNENGFHPESLYAELFLCHLDPTESIHLNTLGENLDTVSSACRVWSPKLRENLFANIFRFLCLDLEQEYQFKLQRIFLRFSPTPADTEYLRKLPHLIDSLMNCRELRLHCRKILIKACMDHNLDVVRYVLKTHPQWKEFIVNSTLTVGNTDERRKFFQRLLSSGDGVPTVVLGSLVSILLMHLENGSPLVSRALEVLVMALETPAKLEPLGNMEQDLNSLVYKLCLRVEDSEDMHSTLSLLRASLRTESESNRHELLEVIANGTTFMQKVVHSDLEASLGVLMYFSQVPLLEPISVPSLQLISLIKSSEVPSSVRRSAILVLAQAVHTKSSSIALNRSFSTDALLSITDDLLLNPLFENEGLELWAAIRKDSSDAALATIIKGRIRMALISEGFFSSRVTVELLKQFRSMTRCADSLRALLPYMKAWYESLVTNA